MLPQGSSHPVQRVTDKISPDLVESIFYVTECSF